MGSTAYFTATDGSGSEQLWKTDGSESGTVLLKEFQQPTFDTLTPVFVEFNGLVYFGAHNGTHRELWRTDGTADGTVVVKEVAAGGNGVAIRAFAVMNDILYFAVDGSERSLWKTDGTDGGTEKIANFENQVLKLVPFEDRLYFRGYDNVHGSELWSSDGTAEGTGLFKDLAAGNSSSEPNGFVEFNDKLYFSASDAAHGTELWTSDGTVEGTQLVSDLRTGPGGSNPRQLHVHGDVLYFAANDGLHGNELWRFNDSGAAPSMVADINPGPASSDPISLRSLGDKLVFAADAPTHGYEMWTVDQNASGASLLLDVNAGFADGIDSPWQFAAVLGDTLYFRARDGVHGSELWKSDGSTAGTQLVADIFSGVRGSNPAEFVVVGDKLIFSARDERGIEIWSSDGSHPGTALVKDINTHSSRSSNPAFMVSSGALSYFVAETMQLGVSLWRTDGTQAGTYSLLDTFAEYVFSTADGIDYSNSNRIENLTLVGTTLFFTTKNGCELWKTDGTKAGTIRVAEINQAATPDERGGVPMSMVDFKGTLFFISSDELWKSDGTPSGTQIVKDLFPNNSTFPAARILGVAGGETLYLRASDGINGYELWKSDGTELGTVSLKGIIPNNPGVFPLSTNGDGSNFYFSLDSSGLGRELWKSDGTLAGTVLVRDINVGSGNSNPQYLADFQGETYFTATNGSGFHQLWKTDGTAEGTLLLKQFALKSQFVWTSLAVEFKGALYFAAIDGQPGIWKTDGSPEGTTLATETGGEIYELIAVDDQLYIAMRPGFPEPARLLVSDGTAAGTQMVKNSDGQTFSNQSLLFTLRNAGGVVHFRSDDGLHGSEPWIVAPPVVPRLFYNNSVFDGRSIAAEAADDAALAVDKLPYRPGSGEATSENVSSYSKGINGLFVDLAGEHGEITATDFVFKIGNNNDPSTWIDAPAPISITVRAGAGVAGGDRVELIWADGAIKNTWLQVIVRGNDAAGGFHTNAGLEQSEVFYWGSKIGDSGVNADDDTFDTTTTDAAQVYVAIGAGKAVGDLRDFNRDGQVTSTDAAIAYANIGSIVRLNIAPDGPFVPEAAPAADSAIAIDNARAASATGKSAVASALAAPMMPKAVVSPPSISNAPLALNSEPSRGPTAISAWAGEPTPERVRANPAGLLTDDWIADSSELDDGLLDLLLTLRR